MKQLSYFKQLEQLSHNIFGSSSFRKLAITTALLGTIVAQFGSATEGVGILMQRFAFRLDMAGSFASLVTMAIMGLLVFTIAEVMDRRIVFWRDAKGLERVSKKKQRKLMVNG